MPWELSKQVLRPVFLASLVVAMHGLILAVLDVALALPIVGYLLLAFCLFSETTVDTIRRVAAFYFRLFSAVWNVALWLAFVTLGFSLMGGGVFLLPLLAIGFLLALTPLLHVLAAIAGISRDGIPKRVEQTLSDKPPDCSAELEDDYRKYRKGVSR